jgi:hypothetical protein
MGTNNHDPYVDGTTTFKATSMNPPLVSLDTAIGYRHNVIVECGGNIHWNGVTTTLKWDAAINIYFTRSDGVVAKNTIATGSLVIATGKQAIVTLNETTGTAITMSASTVTPGTSTTLKTLLTLTLGYTIGTNFFPVALKKHWNSPEFGVTQVATVTSAETISVDLTKFKIADITLDQSPTINLTGGVDGQEVLLRIRQDATGSRVVTWGTMCRGSSDLALPVLTTTASYMDYVKFRYNATDTKYDCTKVIKGFA